MIQSSKKDLRHYNALAFFEFVNVVSWVHKNMFYYAGGILPAVVCNFLATDLTMNIGNV